MILMRNQNELKLIPYVAEESFQEQIKDNILQVDDKALLKIVNRNDTFYLESATYQHHPDDLSKLAAEQASGDGNAGVVALS